MKMKFSWAISHVKELWVVADNNYMYKYSMQFQYLSHQPKLKETETISETSDTNSTLTWLIAKDFIV
jgi:hypothetical protein